MLGRSARGRIDLRGAMNGLPRKTKHIELAMLTSDTDNAESQRSYDNHSQSSATHNAFAFRCVPPRSSEASVVEGSVRGSLIAR